MSREDFSLLEPSNLGSRHQRAEKSHLALVCLNSMTIVSSVQSLSCVRLFATPCTATHQAFLFITNSQNLLKLMSVESLMPSNHLFLCHPLLLLPAIFPRIRVFSNESVLHIRWPKDWHFSFSLVLPVNIQDLFPLGLTPLISLQSKGLWQKFKKMFSPF